MNSGIEHEQLETIVSLLNQCTDAYLFIYDLAADTYSISDEALKIFNLPAANFSNATATIIQCVYPEDRKMLVEDIDSLRSGKKETHNLEYRWLDHDGKPVWISCRGKLTADSSGKKSVLIGRIALIDKGLKVDPLTGLLTTPQLRSDFEIFAKRNVRIAGFLFKIDIDNLGAINEQHGRTVGDRVIELASECCKKSVDSAVKLYRTGSDEIVCMNLSGGTGEDAQELYRMLKRCIADVEQQLAYEVVFTVSAGAVAFFGAIPPLDDLVKKLDFSVSQAKKRGKNTLVMFNAVEYAQHLHRIDLQEKLRLAVKDGCRGFELYYQPVIDAHRVYDDKNAEQNKVIGAEALLRWSCPGLGMLMPDEFIPILEQSSLIIPVGRWILTHAFTQCREWNKIDPSFCMSVNLSYIQIKKNDILTDVQLALEASGVNPENLVLELTESGSIENDTEIQSLLDSFAKMHIKIDIDDFGTGYSNLRYLQDIHANTLKLDYSFVHKATTGNGGEAKVIKYISDMAHDLNMTICLEGVESDDDVKKLKSCEPDKFQGFHFGRPMNAVQFEELNLLKSHM